MLELNDPSLLRTQCLIDGAWIGADDGRTLAVNNPASGEKLATLSPLAKLVGLIARALVDHPDRVEVREVDVDHHPRIELLVAPEDIGKVIGKDGRTAQSIRTLLAAAAMRAGKLAHLDIVD